MRYLVIGRSQGKLSSKGNIEVRVTSLGYFVEAKRHPEPDLIKIDVEGAEFEVLLGAVPLLERRQPVIFLATHSVGLHRRCCQLLRDFNYQLEPLTGERIENTDEILAVPRGVI